MNAMAKIGARLQVLDALEAENAKLRVFVSDVADCFELADLQDLIERATTMRLEWEA